MSTHSPQVFRPRPLDVDTPMMVVIQNDPDDEEELKTEKKFKKREKIIPIPIPVYNELENYEKENSEWQRPASYVIYHEKGVAELEETVEYEMDSEDERFIHTINGAGNKVKQARSVPASKKSSAPLLSEDSLEKMIDVLEKEAFRKIHQIHGRSFLDYLGNIKKKPGPKPAIHSVLKDIEVARPQDDVPCVVCKDEDWDEGNMIVFCDGCDLAVHQTCYGVPQIPRADWYCRRCERMGRNTCAQKHEAEGDAKIEEDKREESKEGVSPGKSRGDRERERHNKYRMKERRKEGGEEFKCVLCGHTGGAVKPTADGKWAHVLCALWLPDAAFMDATIMEPIDTSGISKDRFGLSCEICGTREGCCIQCRTRYCYTAFHPFCAANADLLMEMRPGKGRPNNLLFKTHCTVHSKEIRAERRLETTDKYSDIMNQVCSEEIKMGLHQLVGVPLAVADAVCNFWLAKRQKAKHKDRPLISRLQMDEDAIKDALKKKRSSGQKSIQTAEEYARLRELRRQMDRALIILDVLKKREMYKRDHTRKLQEILDTLVRANEYNFANHDTVTPKKSATLSSSTPTPKKSPSLSASNTTPSTPTSSSTSTSASPLKKTPTKTTQLTLDKFFSAKKDTPNANDNNTNNSSPSKQRKLRDRTTINPAPLPYAIQPTPRATPIRRPPPSPVTSSSDESLSLPHTTRSGKSPDPTRTPDTVRRRAGTPDRSIRSRRSKSPAARRSLSPDLAGANLDDEGEEEEEGEEDDSVAHSSDSENGMVPKSRAHLRRSSSNKQGNTPTTSKKRKRKV